MLNGHLNPDKSDIVMKQWIQNFEAEGLHQYLLRKKIKKQKAKLFLENHGRFWAFWRQNRVVLGVLSFSRKSSKSLNTGLHIQSKLNMSTYLQPPGRSVPLCSVSKHSANTNSVHDFSGGKSGSILAVTHWEIYPTSCFQNIFRKDRFISVCVCPLTLCDPPY